MQININEDLPYIDNPEILSAELRRLYNDRISSKKENPKTKSKNFKLTEKHEILKKTNYHCHVCGQELNEQNFQIDHIIPYSIGGENEIDNYLAACKVCNNYRWNYLPEEIKWIIKIGIWTKTQIEFETEIGKLLAEEFIEYEKSREQRRKKIRQPLTLEIKNYPIREKVDYSSMQKKKN